jgi:hypothetical protein
MSTKVPTNKPVTSGTPAPAAKPAAPGAAPPPADASNAGFIKPGAPATDDQGKSGFSQGSPDAAGGLAPPPPPPTDQSIIDQLKQVFSGLNISDDNKNKLTKDGQDVVNAILKKNYPAALTALDQVLNSDAVGDILEQIKDRADDKLPDGTVKTLLENLDAFVGLAGDKDFQASVSKLSQAKNLSDILDVLKTLPKDDNVRQAVITLVCLDPSVGRGLSNIGLDTSDIRGLDSAAPSVIAASQAFYKGDFKGFASNMMDAVQAAPDTATKLIAKAAKAVLPDGAAKTFLTDDRYKDLLVEILSDKKMYSAFGDLFSKDPKRQLSGLTQLASNKGLTDAVIDAISNDDAIKKSCSPPLTLPDDLKSARDCIPSVIDGARKLRAGDVKGALGCLGDAYRTSPNIPDALVAKLMPKDVQDTFKKCGLSPGDWSKAGKAIPDLYDFTEAVKKGDGAAARSALGNAATDASPVTGKLLAGLAKNSLSGPAKAILGDPQIANMLVGGDPKFYKAVSDLFTGSKDDKINAMSTLINDPGVRELAKVALKQAGIDFEKAMKDAGVNLSDLDIAFGRNTDVQTVPAGGNIPQPPPGTQWVARTTTSTNAEDLGLDVPKINVGGGVNVGVGLDVDHASAGRVTIMRAETPDEAKKDLAAKTDAVKPKDHQSLENLRLGKGGYVEWSGNQSFLTGVHGSVGFGAGGMGINITGQVAAKYSGPVKFRLTQTDDTGKNFALTIDVDKKNAKVESVGASIDPIPNFSNAAIQKVLPVVKKTMEIGIQRQWTQSAEDTAKLNGTVDLTTPGGTAAVDGALNNNMTEAIYQDQFQGSGVQMDGLVKEVSARSRQDSVQLTKFLQGKNDIQTVQALQEQLNGNQLDIQGSVQRQTERKHLFNSQDLKDDVQFFYGLKATKAPLPKDLKPLPPNTARLDTWPEPAGTVADINPLISMSTQLNDKNASGIRTTKDLERYELALSYAGVPPAEIAKLKTLRKGVEAGIYPDPKVWPSWLGDFFTDVGILKRNEPFSLNLDLTAGVNEAGMKQALAPRPGQTQVQKEEEWRHAYLEAYAITHGTKNVEKDGDARKAAEAFVSSVRDAAQYYQANAQPAAAGQSNLFNQPEAFADGAEAKFKAIIGNKSNLPAQLAMLRLAGPQNNVVHTALTLPDDVGAGVLKAGQQRVQGFYGVQQALNMGARMSTYAGAGSNSDNRSQWFSLDFPKGVDPAVAQEVSMAIFGKRIKPQAGQDGSLHFTGLNFTDRNAQLQKVLQNARVVNGQVVLPINWSQKDVQRVMEKVYGKHAKATLTPGLGNAVALDNGGMQFMSVTGAIKDGFPQLFAHGETPQIRTVIALGKDQPQIDVLRGINVSHIGSGATDLDALMTNDDLANPNTDLAPQVSMTKDGDIQADKAELPPPSREQK